MPLEVAAHPEYSPVIRSANVGSFGDGLLEPLSWLAPPCRANLEDFNALIDDAVGDVELRAYVRRRAFRLYEGANDFPDTRYFKLAESHGINA